MNKPVVSLLKTAGNPLQEASQRLLQTSQDRLKRGEYGPTPRCLVLFDTRSAGGAELSFEYEAAGLSTVEAIGLLQAAIHLILSERTQIKTMEAKS